MPLILASHYRRWRCMGPARCIFVVPSLPRTHAQGVSHEDNTRKSLLVTRDAAHVWTGDDGGHVIIWDSQVCPARMGDSDG